MGGAGLLLDPNPDARDRGHSNHRRRSMAHSKSGARKAVSRLAFFRGGRGPFASVVAGDGQSRLYWTLLLYLALVFLIGGASRADVQSLMILRPLAVVVCGVALLTLRMEHVRAYRFLFWMAGLVFLLAGVHLIPLPPEMWQSLPGRDIVKQVDDAVGIKDAWRPLTLAPAEARNAFFALFVPFAALLLVVQLDIGNLKRLLTPLLAIGMFSGVIGIFQVAGDPNGPLYFYRITNNGSAVGLFSNRNHQAVLLLWLFPMIAFFASQSMKTENAIKLRLALAIGGISLLIPLILVTGSRLGIVLGLLALLCSWFIFRRPEASGVRQRTERKNFTIPIMAFLGVMVLILVTVMASRAEGLQRLMGTSVGEEDRSGAWRLASQIAMDNMPFGSGSGSFVPLFQTVEPLKSLSPVYFNHAHNDWLEISMTFGVAGVALLVAAVVAFGLGVRGLLRRGERPGSDILLARTGGAMVLLAGLASVVDYPLRTPSLACLFVVACCWMVAGGKGKWISSGHRDSD